MSGYTPAHLGGGMKRILAAMFGIGVVATLAQVTLLREMLVAFNGNELSFGVMMAAWLVCLAGGAFSARLLRRDCRFRAWTRHLLVVLPMAIAGLLPLQVWWIRGARLLWPNTVGMDVPFVPMLGGVVATCLPCCGCIGLFFPLACEWAVADRRRVDRDVGRTVSRVYTAEALGSTVAGIAVTFVLLPCLSTVQVVGVASLVGLLSTGCLLAGRRSRGLFLLGVVLVAVASSDWMRTWEERLVQRRWQGTGVLGGRGAGAPVVRLVDSVDTVYQNLALTESLGQYALYGSGRLQFIFPDAIADEHRIHAIMGMYPTARRVLILGGNPLGDVREVLKYPLEDVVFVDLDPGVMTLIRAVAPVRARRIMDDPRVTRVIDDGVRYVNRADGRFDVILVNAPQPSTTAANRFYTIEFYEMLRRILSRGGIVVTGLTTSVRLQEETRALGGAVYQALKRVFPVVKVTAGAESRFFAGAKTVLPDGSARITFNRATLYHRSRAAGLDTGYFRPEWFLGADELDAVKTQHVAQRFREAEVKENRITRPAACFANLKLWNRFSGSHLQSLLGAVERLRPLHIMVVLLGVGILLLMGGCIVRWCGNESACTFWVRGAMGLVLVAIGFFSMSMEVLLVMALQGLYGYLYTRMGLIVAAFMLGLVAGAPTGGAVCRRGPAWCWRGCFASVGGLLCIALVAPLMVRTAHAAMAQPLLGRVLECGFYMLVGGVGFLTGTAFAPANLIFVSASGSLGAASAITDASDHFGAAIGALLIGVVLLPVLGVTIASSLLAALMGVMLLVLTGGWFAGRLI